MHCPKNLKQSLAIMKDLQFFFLGGCDGGIQQALITTCMGSTLGFLYNPTDPWGWEFRGSPKASTPPFWRATSTRLQLAR